MSPRLQQNDASLFYFTKNRCISDLHINQKDGMYGIKSLHIFFCTIIFRCFLTEDKSGNQFPASC